MQAPPQRNLGPADTWGRWVEDKIQNFTRVLTQSVQAIERSLSGVNASLTQLTNQQTQLTNQLTQLTNQQTQLTNQQTQLTNQQNMLPIIAAVKNSRYNIPGWSSGTVTLVTTQLTVPANKTRAIITAIPSGVIYIDGAAAIGVTVTVYINGVGTSVAHPWAGESQSTLDYAIVGNALADIVVTPGQQIPVRLDVTATTRPIMGSENWGAINVQGIFSN